MCIELEIHEKLIYKGKPEMRTSRLPQPVRKQHVLHVKLQYANLPFYAPHILIAKFLDIEHLLNFINAVCFITMRYV